MSSGYQRVYVDHVLQADHGCDLDFLVGMRGAEIPRHSHCTTDSVKRDNQAVMKIPGACRQAERLTT